MRLNLGLRKWRLIGAIICKCGVSTWWKRQIYFSLFTAACLYQALGSFLAQSWMHIHSYESRALQVAYAGKWALQQHKYFESRASRRECPDTILTALAEVSAAIAIETKPFLFGNVSWQNRYLIRIKSKVWTAQMVPFMKCFIIFFNKTSLFLNERNI